MSTDNGFGERIYFWVDEDGVRCSPRHRTMKAALGFYQNQNERWVREDGGPKLVAYARDQFPSQKEPVTLRVGQYVERDLSDDEQAKLDQVKALMRDGFV